MGTVIGNPLRLVGRGFFVRGGRSVWFWHYEWCGDDTLKELFPISS